MMYSYGDQSEHFFSNEKSIQF